MEIKNEYTILFGPQMDVITRTERLLNEGWELVGPAVVTDTSCNVYFTQTLIRKHK